VLRKRAIRSLLFYEVAGLLLPPWGAPGDPDGPPSEVDPAELELHDQREAL
jgi:hypothetical protein